MIVAAVCAVAYLVVAPPSPDLAAQTFRADLFASHGYLIWSNDWYSGHYLPGYSVLFPPLGALLGPRVVGAISAVAAAGLFGVLGRGRYGERARLGTLWFGAGTATLLLAGQMTFALGLALGLGAVLAADRGRIWPAALLAALTTLASPVAGLFVALAGVVLGLTTQRRGDLALLAGALVPGAVLAFAFPTSGWFPFVFSAFLPVPLVAAAAMLLLPDTERALRVGAVLYAVLCAVFFVLHTPVGANAARLGALFAGPVFALALWGRRPWVLGALAIPLLYWQWSAPVRDVAAASGEHAFHESFYEPLVAKLERVAPPATRIEIPPTRVRGEAAYVAPSFPLARGWLRQSETADFDLFTDRHLTAASYRGWLDDHGVSYVALANAELDYLAEDEAAVIRAGPPYLRPVWSSSDWTLYRVAGSPGVGASALGPDWFEVTADRPGTTLVRIRWSPYWTVTSGDGCVERDGDWTAVDSHHPGTLHVAARFSLGGLLRRESACSG